MGKTIHTEGIYTKCPSEIIVESVRRHCLRTAAGLSYRASNNSKGEEVHSRRVKRNDWWRRGIKSSQVVPAAGTGWQVLSRLRLLICCRLFLSYNNLITRRRGSALQMSRNDLLLKWHQGSTAGELPERRLPFGLLSHFAPLSASAPQRLGGRRPSEARGRCLCMSACRSLHVAKVRPQTLPPANSASILTGIFP